MKTLGRPRFRWEDNIRIPFEYVAKERGLIWLKTGTNGGALWTL
jgi:hypothetical protein